MVYITETVRETKLYASLVWCAFRRRRQILFDNLFSSKLLQKSNAKCFLFHGIQIIRLFCPLPPFHFFLLIPHQKLEDDIEETTKEEDDDDYYYYNGNSSDTTEESRVVGLPDLRLQEREGERERGEDDDNEGIKED